MRHALPMPQRVRQLVHAAARDHGTTPADVLSRSRLPRHVVARWDAMARARALDSRPSFPLIAGWFGLDHTSVRYGILRHHGMPGRRR